MTDERIRAVLEWEARLHRESAKRLTDLSEKVTDGRMVEEIDRAISHAYRAAACLDMASRLVLEDPETVLMRELVGSVECEQIGKGELINLSPERLRKK